MAAVVIYYSRAGENYFGGQYRYVDKGNTEIVAEKIAAATGAALFGIECTVYIAAQHIEKQALNLFKIDLLAAKVQPLTT